MTKIAHIADTHLCTRQYGRDLRGKDSFNGFFNAVHTAIAHGANGIICAGDVVDNAHPSAVVISSYMYAINQLLETHNIQMYVISGNHDCTSPHWCASFSHMKVIDHAGVSVNDISIYGLPWMDVESTRAHLATAPAADILVWHGDISDFTGSPKAVSLDDVPLNRWKILALGDQHISCSIQRKTDGLLAVYPGSTEMRSASEEDVKNLWMYTFTNGEVTHECIPFATRPVQRLSIMTPTDLEQACINLKQGALVYVDHKVGVPDVIKRLSLVASEDTILQYTLRPDLDAVENWNPTVATTLTPVEYANQRMEHIIPDTEMRQRISKCCLELLDVNLDPKDVLSKYCTDRLGVIIS